MNILKKENQQDKKGKNMKEKKVIFMGTPSYSIPVLKMLIENTNVIAVITQPDKEIGRKKILTPCPVKQLAQEQNIKVISPHKLKEEYQQITELNPDIIITCAYGQILPEELIYSPKYNTVNVHASLLPKYRGGAPIHHAIINGEKETGITIMYTDKGMDSGDIITQEKIEINENDTYDIINQKMSELGAKLLKETLPSIFNNTAPRQKQDDTQKTLAPIIKREDEHIEFNKTAEQVHNKIRGLSSIPGAYTLLENTRIKILQTEKTNNKTNKTPGTITKIEKDGIYVACNDKEIKITQLQVSGKKPMLVKDYLNGIKKENLLEKILN